MAAWAVAVDFILFAPLFALSMFLFLLRARREIDRWRQQPPSEVKDRLRTRRLVGTSDRAVRVGLGAYRTIATTGLALIVIGFIADELENVANLTIVDFGWTADPNYTGGAFHALVWLLWVTGGAKWLFDLGAIGVVLLVAWVLVTGGGESLRERWTTVRPQLHVLRFQLILVAAAAAVPFAHEQIPDLVRRWGVGQLALTAALAWALALTTWLVGRRLLVHGQWRPRWNQRRRVTVARVLFATVLILAAIQGVAHVLSHGRYQAGWGLAIPAVILATLGVLGWLLPKLPRRAVRRYSAPLTPDSTHPRLPRALAALVVVAFGLGILHATFGYSVYARSWTWKTGPVIALAVVVVAALLAWALGREPLLGAGVGGLVGLTLLPTTADELWPPVLVFAALLLVVSGWRLYEALGNAPVASGSATISWPLVLGLGLGLAALYAAVVAFPLQIGERLGAVAILLFFFLVLTCVGALVAWVTPALPVPRALRVLGVSRFPVVTLLLVWFLAASWLDAGGYHNVRLKDSDSAAAGVTLTEAFECWLGKNGLEENSCAPPQVDAGSPRGPVPLILVATTGGGIRAAYWTDLVLDCAFEASSRTDCPTGEHASEFSRSDHLFALSGISGGSVGLASYAAYLSEKGHGPERKWVERSLGADALSGSGAWWLLVELPRTFLQFRSPTDRAGILERGWERQWPHGELSQGLLELWRTEHHQPLLMLNGTSVEDGCRFETSPLNGNVETTSGASFGCRSIEPFDVGGSTTRGAPAEEISAASVLPATRDLVDFLCGDEKDVRLSTAGLLSGRFPFVNPSARVQRRCKMPGVNQPVAYVVDGGYLDTSGASPIVELMLKLQPLVDGWNRREGNSKRCIVPLMIQIDNGFTVGSPRQPHRPGELLVPLKTVFATRGAREAEGRVGAALLFTPRGSARTDRYAHFVNEAHPGPKAPLGWTQSRVSERELISQLDQPRNRKAFDEVRRWLGGRGLACSAAQSHG